MASQTSANVLVALKRETTTGTAATAADASQLRITDSPGLELKRAQVQSAEKRDDGLKTMGRLGHKSVDGSYNGELTVGGAINIILEAIMRSTWVAADTCITCDGGAAFTSLEATSSSTIALNGTGSFITEGVKIGDVVRLSAYDAAVNDINCLVVNVAANLLTLAGTPLTTKAADTNAALTILRKVKTATTPTRYSHTIEQYDQDIDLTELFLGCRAVGFKLSFKPGAMATWQATFMGMDRTLLVVGTSPWFTTPSVTTGLGMIADDSAIYKNGALVANFTGFDIDFTISAKTEPTIGNLVSPDVFDNDLTVSGTISGIRQDFADLILFDAETEFAIGIMLQDPSISPKGAMSFWFPRVKLASVAAPVGGGDGAKIETKQLMIGAHAGATNIDAGICTICVSAT